ncbi:hypothetical protein SUGI_0851880 [Cryptomeria japonica]|nr:hypothetical protein SUGI_0851880 [Cryptomeria japonica]
MQTCTTLPVNHTGNLRTVSANGMGDSGKKGPQGQIKQQSGDPIGLPIIKTLSRSIKGSLHEGDGIILPINLHIRNYKVWIRLYNCPTDYWDIDVIKDLGNKLGTFVLVDGIQEDKLWGSFLRICINTEHVSKIPKEIKIAGTRKVWIQRIDREDQLHICPRCFSLDHLGLDCEMVASIQRNYACMQTSLEEEVSEAEAMNPLEERQDHNSEDLNTNISPSKEIIPVNIGHPPISKSNTSNMVPESK